MIPTDVKKIYGEEYPAAIITDGIRAPLHRESRFSRHYRYGKDKQETTVGFSRFMDGSASITAVELERDWASWTRELQIDFCQRCRDLFGQSDFPEMLHFVMLHGNSEHWVAIALTVAYHLPQQEAFDFLVQALQKAGLGRSSNITQGIAATKHSSAESVLRKHLNLIWAHPALWDDSTFLNWIAVDATNCIAHLIEVGASPVEFTEKAQRLSQHICPRNRVSWSRRLSKHYPKITLPD